MTDVVIVLIGRARHTYILYLLLYDTCGGSSTFFFWLRIAISYECTIISCSYRLVLREAFSKLLNKLYSYRLHSRTFQIGVFRLEFPIIISSPPTLNSLHRVKYYRLIIIGEFWQGCGKDIIRAVGRFGWSFALRNG